MRKLESKIHPSYFYKSCFYLKEVILIKMAHFLQKTVGTTLKDDKKNLHYSVMQAEKQTYHEKIDSNIAYFFNMLRCLYDLSINTQKKIPLLLTSHKTLTFFKQIILLSYQHKTYLSIEHIKKLFISHSTFIQDLFRLFLALIQSIIK